MEGIKELKTMNATTTRKTASLQTIYRDFCPVEAWDEQQNIVLPKSKAWTWRDVPENWRFAPLQETTPAKVVLALYRELHNAPLTAGMYTLVDNYLMAVTRIDPDNLEDRPSNLVCKVIPYTSAPKRYGIGHIYDQDTHGERLERERQYKALVDKFDNELSPKYPQMTLSDLLHAWETSDKAFSTFYRRCTEASVSAMYLRLYNLSKETRTVPTMAEKVAKLEAEYRPAFAQN